MSLHPNWADVKGDDTYAIDWTLDENSLVFEVGAYEGRWAKQIMAKYNCTVHAFEPQTWAVVKLLNLEPDFPKLKVHPYALGTRNARLPMGEFETDACSFLLLGQRKNGFGDIYDACDVIAKVTNNGQKRIDLMMINIEGYEYELINYIIECGAIDIIDRLVVQYHEFADPDGTKYTMLCDKFKANDFKLLWSFFPTLEARVRGIS